MNTSRISMPPTDRLRSDLAIASLDAGHQASLSITPVIHPKDGVPDPACRTFWSATANALYIVRKSGADTP